MSVLYHEGAGIVIDSKNLTGLLFAVSQITHLVSAEKKELSVFIHELRVVLHILIIREELVKNVLRDDYKPRTFLPLQLQAGG